MTETLRSTTRSPDFREVRLVHVFGESLRVLPFLTTLQARKSSLSLLPVSGIIPKCVSQTAQVAGLLIIRQICVLDEPSNFLDREALGGLAVAIRDWAGAVVGLALPLLRVVVHPIYDRSSFLTTRSLLALCVRACLHCSLLQMLIETSM